MKVVLAVSGGVDSIVMLDIVYHAMHNASSGYSCSDIIVAHFNHGIRDNAAEDEEFVRRKAAEYGLAFVSKQADLGAEASEAKAREARYDFLRTVADNDGVIFTAHHLDDLMETLLINFVRGTGWRGLACLEIAGVRRPFLETELVYELMDKAAIFEYAAKRRLEFREDQSNSWDEYLRNRIRHQMNNVYLDFEQKLQIWQLWQAQRALRHEIDHIVTEMLPQGEEKWQRDWFKCIEQNAAIELLRAGTLRAGISATRPQLANFLDAILTYQPGKKFNLPGDHLIKLTKDEFVL